MRPKAETRKLEQHFSKFMDEMEDENDRIRRDMLRHELLPREWLDLHKQVPTQPPKCKLTLSLDQNVVDWYRALGRGYQARMNGVLRAYMLAILSKSIEQPGDRDWRGAEL